VAVVELDPYVLDALMPDLVGHDRRPSAFLVYLLLWRHTRGGRVRRVPLSLGALAEGTGLSKRAVQGALATLRRRRLVSAERASTTAVPEYTLHRTWVR
jgi:DNA-binding GntR family transcriptional regulator